MNSIFKIICSSATAGSILLSSCASIVSKSNWPVSITSQPTGLEFIIKKPDGTAISNGKTPQIVTLDSSAGYFKPASYIIQTKRGNKVIGEQEITAGLNGWYFGNILFGGLIGLIIVDPLTGAMYRLPESVSVLGGKIASNSSHSLTIASVDTLTPDQRAQLVRL